MAGGERLLLLGVNASLFPGADYVFEQYPRPGLFHSREE